MERKITVRRYGQIHYHAGCETCDFNAAIQTAASRTPEDVRRLVRAHVRKTGHVVWIESGTHTTYKAGPGGFLQAVEPVIDGDG